MTTVRTWFAARLSSYGKDEGGAVIAYILLMFLMMIVAAGGAIDFMRHENVRTRLQNGLDRGVLAAAAFNQTIGEREVVAGYLKTAGFPAPVTLEVDPVVPSLNSRRVQARAQLTIRTFFLKIIGINTLTVAASGAAEQQRQHVEISLALDISGSMARELTGGSATERRLSLMRDKAQEFIDLILNEDTIATTTVNLIPYAGQVNPGQAAFNYLNNGNNYAQNYSRCIDFNSGDMDDMNIPGRRSRPQTPHFQWFTFEGSRGYEADWGWCPSNARAITYFSNDAADLKAEIGSFRAHDGTGSNIAFKWALSILNPDNAAFLTALRDAGEFTQTDRPAPFLGADALKIIVMMTDGNTRYQRRPYAQYYNSDREVQQWATQNLSSNRSYESTTEYNARLEMRALCDLAQANDVVVFTVGFDIDAGSDAYDDMRYCASTASHFFDVDGADLGTAFKLIAATIANLRLVE
ncbi:TadE/TadG family type IV pilus assembly protein [Abyssibius alkaniclasticus]|uniref:TadE/TadG family type IV pilus assembly protein n=1 Tax=Abyssibius alkaniclasticus TaxID=2881234 RepID=UPI0040595143